MSAEIVEVWPRDTSHFERLLHLAGVQSDMAICAAGRGNGDLMIKLCREGYVRVECLRQATCTCADEGADVLVISGATGAESLISILLRTGRVLRDGGLVALKLEEVDDDCAVQSALASLGFEVVSTVFDLSGDVLVAHAVRRAEMQALAS